MTRATLDFDDEVNVEFRTCFMTNVADPMIQAVRGHFSLNECALHTYRVHHDKNPNPMPDGNGPILNSSNGSDIFIEAPRSVDGHLDAPASFTAREVESQSYQFLATFRDGVSGPSVTGVRPTGERSACVLLNVHHVCVAGGPTDSDDPHHPLDRKEHRPSVYWAGPGVTGAHLIAISCRWAEQYAWGDSHDPALQPASWSGPLGGIRLANGQTGDIYHMGNTTFRSDVTSFNSTREDVRPEGIIRAELAEGPVPPMRIRTLPLILARSR